LFRLHVRLRICEHKIELASVPVLEDRKNETHPDGGPLDNRGISLPVVYPVLLLASMHV
jgi:hypothetical protein